MIIKGRKYKVAVPTTCSGLTKGYQLDKGEILTAIGLLDQVTYAFKYKEPHTGPTAQARVDDGIRYIDIAKLNHLDLITKSVFTIEVEYDPELNSLVQLHDRATEFLREINGNATTRVWQEER